MGMYWLYAQWQGVATCLQNILHPGLVVHAALGTLICSNRRGAVDSGVGVVTRSCVRTTPPFTRHLITHRVETG